MSVNKAEKIEEFDESGSALSASHIDISGALQKLPKEFGLCWEAIEIGNEEFDEHGMRRKIESAIDQHLEPSVTDYFRRLVLSNPFTFFTKGLRIKLLGDIERRWRHKDKSDEEDAHKLRQCILSLLRPYMDCAPPKMRLRVRIDLWQKPQPIPAHNTAPAFGIAIDASTGEIHRRFYGTNMPISETPLISCGLTILIQPFRYGDEPWTQEQGQGGYMYSEDQTVSVNARTMPLITLKP